MEIKNKCATIIIGFNNRYADMAELADALDLGSSGRPWGFKSLYPHHGKPNRFLSVRFFVLFLVKGLERVGIGDLQV